MSSLNRQLLRYLLTAALVPLVILGIFIIWDLDRLHSDTPRLRWTLLVAFALATAIAAALAFRFSRRISEPVGAISLAVRQVGDGEWTLISRVSGPDEIQKLAQDINRMVERLHERVQETGEDRTQLETILGQMDDGLVVVDERGRILRINAAAERLLEVNGAAPEGRLLLEAAPMYPLDAAARRALAGGHPEPVDLRSPGAGLALRVLASPMATGRGQHGAVLLIQDLTEVRRVDEMRRDFVANVSHELRTPIAALRALSETLILRSERRPEIVGDYALKIAREAQRLGEMVEGLLTLSRIESGKWELRLAALDPEALIQDLADRYRASGDSREVALTVQRTSAGGMRDIARVQADRSAVETALGNLVDNALKYTPPGGEVTLSVRRRRDEIVFTVADNGVGIAPDELHRIFERFYRVDPSRSREIEGTGLGLAIVKHLCENQGGRVWVESELGKGSAFHVALPASAPTIAR